MSKAGIRVLHRLAGASTVVVAVLATVAVTAAGALGYEPGIDTSHYQHSPSLDWAKVKADGVEFAFLKATEGGTFTDPYFAADWAATTQLGIYRGAYHFARPSKGTAAAQAKRFVGVAGTAAGSGDLPPVLDLEVTGGLSVAALRTWTANFLATVEQLTGRTPVIYCSPSFWETNLGNDKGFTRYPLWIAHYTTATQPRLPGGWTTWTFWQNTSSGSVNGISGNVDQDRFNGTLADLQVLANATGQAPTPSPTPGPTPSPTASPSPTPTASPSPTPTASPSPTPTASPTPTPTPTPTPVTESPSPAPVTTATTLRAGAASVYRGTGVAFTGSVRTGPVAGGTPVPGRTVALARRLPGSTSWVRVTTGSTDAAGGFALRAVVDRDAAYRARLLGDTSYAPSGSPVVDVATRPRVATALSLRTMRTTVRRRHPVTLYGHLVTAAGAGVAGRRVVLWKRVLGTSRWVRVAAGTSIAPTGWWQVTVRPRRSADYRAAFGGTVKYLGDRSNQVRVRAR